jgi:uncharacterized protein
MNSGEASSNSARISEKSAAAVACFVKTPRLSPVKTRLAAEIGTARAEEFYGLAIEAVREVLHDVKTQGVATPFWAVAEAEGVFHPLWQDLGCLSQGEGELGERLARVYRRLREEYDRVLFIGADSPQLTSGHLAAALRELEQGTAFVLGRCPDGGFYLFAGAQSIPEAVWTETPWSTPSTADEFQARLMKQGPVALLTTMCDVDVVDDLERLRRELESLRNLLPSQAQMLSWLNEAPASRR